jgi:hypothetical protein
MSRWLVRVCLGLVACGGSACGDAAMSEDGKAGHSGHDDGGNDADDRDGGQPDGSAAEGKAGRGGHAGSTGGSSSSDGGAGMVEGRDEKAWTVFVYGHGDHSLSNSLVRDIAEMAQAEISDDVNVIVLADFDASQKVGDSGEMFPDGVQWLRVTGSGQEPETVGVDDELDLDDPDVLGAAVATAFANFPAKRRAVILWDHGGSWQGGFGGDTQNGTVTEVHRMSPATVAHAVAAGMNGAEVDQKPPLDIFSFDACLMAGSEVAFEMRDLASVYIANAEIDYGDGWDYKAFLTHLSKHQGDSAAKLASSEVDEWDAQHKMASANDILLRSHVALDNAKLGAFGDAFQTFSDTWLASDAKNAVELGRASYFTLPQYMSQLETPGALPELRDVGQFLDTMAHVSDDAIASAAGDAADALEDTIIRRSQGDLREAAGQRGFHVELPLAAAMSDALIASYKAGANRWNKASHWDQALLAYGLSNDGAGPTISAALQNGTDPDAAHLPMIDVSTSDRDIAEATVDLARVDPSAPDQLLFFGIVGKGAITPDDVYEFAWNGRLITLPDDVNGGNQPIFVRTWEDLGSDTSTGEAVPSVLASFGMLETSDGTQALSALIFQDGDTDTSVMVLLDPPATLLLSQIATDLPGSTFTPVLASLSTDTQEERLIPGTPIQLNSESLPLSSLPADGGRYALVTSMTDVFGNDNADVQVVDLTAPIQ